MGVEYPADKAFPRQENRHEFAEHVGYHADEEGGYAEDLRFEVVDCGESAPEE
jgi:hypothetical protein